jgi:hypothetical protein
MSEPLTHTFSVVVEKQVTDLEMCLMTLRLVARTYPRHFDIALEALQAEYRIPPVEQVSRESHEV